MLPKKRQHGRIAGRGPFPGGRTVGEQHIKLVCTYIDTYRVSVSNAMRRCFHRGGETYDTYRSTLQHLRIWPDAITVYDDTLLACRLRTMAQPYDVPKIQRR
jgi:hypothetical protein